MEQTPEIIIVPPSLEPIEQAGNDLGELVGLAALAFLVGFTVFNIFQFLGHYVDAANRKGYPVPSLGTYLRAFAGEWWWSLAATLSWPIGFVPRLPARHVSGGGPPVVLIHGYLMNRMCMFAMYWRLRRLGYDNVRTVNLRPMFGSIESMGTLLKRDLQSFSELCGGEEVVCICHSMGGLVTRWLLEHDPDLPISKVITLGSPHHGTRWAVLGSTHNAAQMREGSEFLERLSEDTRVPLVSIYSATDEMVVPSESAELGHTRIRFEHLGHMALLFDGRVFDAVAHHLPAESNEELAA